MQRRPRVTSGAEANAPSLQEAVRLRRDTVLRAARRVFERKGLEDASIRLIAEAAGLTTGAIYPYFSGKEEIYAELLSESLGTLRDALAAVRAHDGRARFRAMLECFFGFYEARPNDLSLALYLFRGLKPQGLTPELNRRLNAKGREVLAVMGEAVGAVSRHAGHAAETEVGLQVTFLFGLLTIHHTKRSRMLGVDPRALLSTHIDQTLERLVRTSVDPAVLHG